LALMMAVMVLGMPPVHSCHTGTGSEALGGGSRIEPRTYPPIPATGEQNRPTALHKTSPAEQDKSAALRVSKQIQLEAENVRRVREEIQKERLEKQRAHQLEMEGMQRAHRLEMEGMRRAHQLEMGEMQRTFRLEIEGTLNTHQPQAEIQKHQGEMWKPGDEGSILARVGGANLTPDRGGTAPIN
jgi:hypothetical protein